MGLSVTEAMAYGKPVFSFRRSLETKQGVEYGYLDSGVNGYIFDTLEDLFEKLKAITTEDIRQLGLNAREFVKKNLCMDNMVNNAAEAVEMVMK